MIGKLFKKYGAFFQKNKNEFISNINGDTNLKPELVALYNYFGLSNSFLMDG